MQNTEKRMIHFDINSFFSAFKKPILLSYLSFILKMQDIPKIRILNLEFLYN